jgi:hypothetical protein
MLLPASRQVAGRSFLRGFRSPAHTHSNHQAANLSDLSQNPSCILLARFNLPPWGIVGYQSYSGQGCPADSFINFRIVSSFGSGAFFSLRTSSQPTYHLRRPISQMYQWTLGHGYPDDATLVAAPPRRQGFQGALNNTNTTVIQLQAGLYFQNAVIGLDLTIRGEGIGRTLVSGGLLGSVFGIVPGEAGDRDAERRAAYVGEAEPVAELHRVRVASVFAADLPAGRQVPSLMPFLTAIFINRPTHAARRPQAPSPCLLA